MATQSPLEAFVAYCRDTAKHVVPRPAPVPAGPTAPVLGGGARAVSTRVDITPELGVPLTGYGVGAPDRRCAGWLGALHALVLLLDDGDGNRHAILAFDLHVAPRVVVERIVELAAARDVAAAGPAELIGLSVDRIFVCAAHVHASPGNFYGAQMYERIVTPPPSSVVDRRYPDAVAAKVVEALATLARALPGAKPSELAYGESKLYGPIWQRAMLAHAENHGVPLTGPGMETAADTTAAEFSTAPEVAALRQRFPDPRARAVDPRIRVLVWRSADDEPDTVLAFASVTPTMLPAMARVAGADAFGMASRYAESRLASGRAARVALMGSAHGDTFLVDPSVSRTDPADPTAWKAFHSARAAAERWARLVDYLPSVAANATRLGAAIVAAIEQARAAFSSGAALHAFPAQVCFSEAVMAGQPAGDGVVGRIPEVGAGMVQGNDFESGVKFLGERYPLADDALPAWVRRGRRRKNGNTKPTDAQHPKDVLTAAQLLDIKEAVLGRDIARLPPFVTLRTIRFATRQGGPGVMLAGVPFEPSTWAAREIERALTGPGAEPGRADEAIVACLAGDYLGYLVTSNEYRAQLYEGGSCWFGRNTHAWVLEHVRTMVATGLRAVTLDAAYFSSQVGTVERSVDLPLQSPNPDRNEHWLEKPVAYRGEDGAAWIRLEGGWAAGREDRVFERGDAPWLRLRLRATTSGPSRAALLDGGIPADDKSGWLLVRRAPRKRNDDEEGTTTWRWTACLRRPPDWTGEIGFEVVVPGGSEYDSVRPVHGKFPWRELPPIG